MLTMLTVLGSLPLRMRLALNAYFSWKNCAAYAFKLVISQITRFRQFSTVSV